MDKRSGDLLNEDFEPNMSTIRIPRTIAEIRLCGSICISITDDTNGWIEPTPEQIKNLHDTFCIDVTLFDKEGNVRNG